MAVLEPQSNITLVNVPWDNNYQNVRNFNDIGAQNTYFSNLFPRINFEDYTFLRKRSKSNSCGRRLSENCKNFP